MKRWAPAALILAVLTGCGGEQAFAVDAAASGSLWRPLDPATLADLYSGKTWFWKDGAAYFAPDRRFRAWSRSNNELSEGVGTWRASPKGVMCFDASWRTVASRPDQAASSTLETCFSHGARGAAISQRRLPDGSWYYFRSPTPAKTDEFFKLQPGDRTGLKS